MSSSNSVAAVWVNYALTHFSGADARTSRDMCVGGCSVWIRKYVESAHSVRSCCRWGTRGRHARRALEDAPAGSLWQDERLERGYRVARCTQVAAECPRRVWSRSGVTAGAGAQSGAFQTLVRRQPSHGRGGAWTLVRRPGARTQLTNFVNCTPRSARGAVPRRRHGASGVRSRC